MQMKKKLLPASALILSLVMLSGLPLTALAANTVGVTFRLVGTDADGGYKTWIASKPLTVPADSTASDVLLLALSDTDITPSVVDLGWGGYLSAVTAPAALGGFTLSEHTAGEWPDAVFSGWMFSVNNILSPSGMSDTLISEGDVIVFFYAHDMNDGVDWETSDASGAPALAAPDTDPAVSTAGVSEPEAARSSSTGDAKRNAIWLLLAVTGLSGVLLLLYVTRKKA
jgi:hypothetical protein